MSPRVRAGLVFVLFALCGAAAGNAAVPSRLDGSVLAPAASAADFRQTLHEARNRAPAGVEWPSPADLRAVAARSKGEAIPIAVLDVPRPEGEGGGSDPLGALPGRVFAAAVLRPWTHRGAGVEFRVAPELWIGESPERYARIRIDCDDGADWRDLGADGRVSVSWSSPGSKVLRLRAETETGESWQAAFLFDVHALATPAPDDTLQITASVPYLGSAGTADVYVYRAPGHATLVNPVVVVEGFDIEDTLDWEELYELLNQEGLLETLRASGFDAVIINFDDATDYMQRNAHVVTETIAHVNATMTGSGNIALVGASMGGLLSRFSLAWMEQQAIDANVRTFVSFDSPQTGANIPLGVQYWLDFFSEQSADAEFLLSRLDRPAARQLLLYHHTDPPGTTGEADPLRGEWLTDLAAVGDWPAATRMVAVANGSGFGDDQGFPAGAQIIDYEYSSFLVDVIGNVWAVPDGVPGTIFDGELNIILLPPETMTVTVSGTLPWDSAPGGYRGSMATMDSTQAPFGDIVALYDNHCFVPTISSLALDVTDPFYDIAGDPNLLTLTPFDDVYFPDVNQEHIFIDAESAAWLLAELSAGATGVVEPGVVVAAPVLQLLGVGPNPFRADTVLRFRLGAPRRVTAAVYDVAGRRVGDLLRNAPLGSGTHELRWPPDAGGRAAAGVYWVAVDAGEGAVSRRVVRLD